MSSYSLSEHRVELLGDIVLLVGDPLGTEVENEVGVGLEKRFITKSIGVSRTCAMLPWSMGPQPEKCPALDYII